MRPLRRRRSSRSSRESPHSANPWLSCPRKRQVGHSVLLVVLWLLQGQARLLALLLLRLVLLLRLLSLLRLLLLLRLI